MLSSMESIFAKPEYVKALHSGLGHRAAAREETWNDLLLEH